jgi:hypothetical protein
VGVGLSSRSLALNVNTHDSLSYLDGLQNLTPFNNSLGGVLPSWLGKLAGGLTALDLGRNQLACPLDKLPWPVMKGLKALTFLELGFNQLTGPIDSVKGLTGLTVLGLSGNQLNGATNPVKGLTGLVRLDISNMHQITGTIGAVSGLTALTNLGLGNSPKLSASINAVATQRACTSPTATPAAWCPMDRLTGRKPPSFVTSAATISAVRSPPAPHQLQSNL